MDSNPSDSALVQAAGKKKRSATSDFFIQLITKKPLGAAGCFIVLILLFVGIFANVLAPFGMNETHPLEALQPPSGKYLLGTDQMGRDLLTRVIYGARISLIVGLSATIISVIKSTLIGIVTGYFGKTLDMTIQRIVDAWMSIPNMVLLIIVISIMGIGMWQVIISMGLLFGVAGSRIVRGAVIDIKQSLYIKAAVAIGCPTPKILIRHILPNIMAPIIVLLSTRMPALIMLEASLSFLGLGIPPPQPSWGSMLSGSGRSFMFLSPWMAVWPGLALAIVVYGVNMFGDALRDLLDPRLRGGGGRFDRKKGQNTNSQILR
jgi:peptide/nickel transport system permease protein